MGIFSFMFAGGKGKGKKKLARVDIKKRFDILGKLGQGSMSKVFRATDRKLGRAVCLKVLDKEKTARFEARFATMSKPPEGEIITALRNKHVVQAFEHGLTIQGEPFIVFELIDGLGLNFLIETKNPQLDGRRIDYLAQLATGLDYIHKQGYLHRDICPRNVLITKDDLVKYIDFGLAIPLRPEFCQPGNRTGSANYLAPELIKRRATDHRVDLFALGVTAYEMITSTLPWESAKSSDAYRDHINNPGRDPRNYVPDLDEKIAKFLTKAIEREPRDRFQTAADMKEALQALPAI